MSSGPWSLPGPVRFVHRIRSDIWARKNIIVGIKRFAPPGLATAVEEAVRTHDLFVWRRMSADAIPDAKPAEALASVLCPEQITAGMTPLRLATVERLAGVVCWISGVTAATTDQWCPFVAEYAEAARNLSNEPPLFVLAVEDVPGPLAMNRAGLTVLNSDDAVTASDTACLVTALLEGRFCRLHRLLHAAVTAELAGTDLSLAESLAGLDLRELLSPESTLRERAMELGWVHRNEVENPDERWHGRRRGHSAWEALNGNADEVERRIWRGQVQALFPLVEEIRLNLVGQVRHLLDLPFKTEFGIITDAEDLEVGPLYYLLQRARAPRPVIDLAKTLKNLRHDLAHLRPVKLDDLSNARLIQAAE